MTTDSVPQKRPLQAFIPGGMGWLPDLPDGRDYTCRHDEILPWLTRPSPKSRKTPPDEIDLRGDEEGDFLTPPGNQGPLNCSAAFAVLSLLEYFERRVHGRTFEGSKLFLYKVTRNRLYPQQRARGDTGADLRTTLKALVRFGVPPEEYWPYNPQKFEEEPGAFLYGLARPLSELRYFRLDEPNRDGATTWETVTAFIAAGFPVAFGFPVPASMTADANIPWRPNLDCHRGGQVALAIGYRRHHFGRGRHALLIRNSWGSQWGDNGNGWLPAAFVQSQLARDFWTLVSDDYLETEELSSPEISRIAAVASSRR